MATVTKKELIDRICDQLEAPRTVVKSSIQAFLEAIVEELARGNRLEFRDFGVFETKLRAARKAQNPKTLERVEVPPRRAVKFKPGHLMRDALDDSPSLGDSTGQPAREPTGAHRSAPAPEAPSLNPTPMGRSVAQASPRLNKTG